MTSPETAGAVAREHDEPAHTITGKGTAAWRLNDQSGSGDVGDWVASRPATTVATRDLIGAPGANANRFNGSTKSRNDGVRVTVAEAGVLQSFPADHPWQGTKTKQYQQIGNAVPPLMAAHVLAAATGLALEVADRSATTAVAVDCDLVVSTGANSMVTSRVGSKAGDGGVQHYERTVNAPAPTVDGKAPGAWAVHESGKRLEALGRSPFGVAAPPTYDNVVAVTFGVAAAPVLAPWQDPAWSPFGVAATAEEAVA